VAVFLASTQAENRGSHWYGGPDFAVEVVSPGDRVLEKLSFYAAVGTSELLVIDRDPWRLERFGLEAGKMQSVGRWQPASPCDLTSQSLGLTFTLRPAADRPLIEVRHNDSRQTWSV
jgi:Uma2 family endonuclease